ncbi:amidohydrolase [candidate division KSB1 bacterium]
MRYKGFFNGAARSVIALICFFISCSPSESGIFVNSAGIVFYNARVLTMDDDRPEASAVAVSGDVISAVGSMNDMERLIGPRTELYDLSGRTIIPGINETHIHVRDLGFEQHYAVNLEQAQNIADVQRMLAERLEQLERGNRLGGWRYPTTGEEGSWLFGLGWTQDRLEEKRMANRHELDEVSREVPIALNRIYDGIAVNTKVFELMGINFTDPATYPDWFMSDPEDFVAGDIIFRDPETGLPNGVFVGSKAPGLVSHAVPEKTLEQRVESLVLGLNVLASMGITSVVEAGSSMGSVTRIYQEAYDRDLLPIRTIVYDGWYRGRDPNGLGDPAEIEKRVRGFGFHHIGDNMFRIRGAKSSADGGVGSRSAAVSEPYLPVPGDPFGDNNYGAYRDPDFNLRFEQFRILSEYGWEIHTHCCGDAAMRQTMDAYKILMDQIWEKDPEADLRWSIIHAYMPDEPATSVLKEMADYGIIAAINPPNLYFEGDSFVRNIGLERMARHTPYKKYLDAGVLMASGSDYPNNSADPWYGIYHMRTRRNQISGEVHGPDQRISLTEALKTYTINGAYLTYDEKVRGSLETGKLADLVILDADLPNVPDEELLTMSSNTLLTMAGGKIVYTRDGFRLQELRRNQ